jgi:2-polyprenyl-3-methyl-5-hydroxy-6-metoxy-1,4-benzoquinol methylase
MKMSIGKEGTGVCQEKLQKNDIKTRKPLRPHESASVKLSSMVSRQQHLLVKKEFSRARAYALEYQGKNGQAHFFNIRIRRVAELLNDFHQGSVLDIGCGPGLVGNIFRRKPVEYHGVDLSAHMIETCHDYYAGNPQFQFSVQPAEKLAFADNSFDTVLCLGLLEYVLDQSAVIHEVDRVLKPGGCLICTMLNKWCPYFLWGRWIQGRLSNALRKAGWRIKGQQRRKEGMEAKWARRPSTKMLEEKDFRKLLITNGFRIEDALYYSFRIIPPPLDSLLPRASVFVSRKLEFLCRSPLRFLGQGNIIKCRKATN